MKKYELKPQTFMAEKYDGDADHIIAAAEGQSTGSADSFDYNEHHRSTSFVDANEQPATLMPGDYLQVVLDTDGTTFKGYVAVPAAIGDANWQEVPVAA